MKCCRKFSIKGADSATSKADPGNMLANIRYSLLLILSLQIRTVFGQGISAVVEVFLAQNPFLPRTPERPLGPHPPGVPGGLPLGPPHPGHPNGLFPGPHQPGHPEGLLPGRHQPGGPGELPFGPHQPGQPEGLLPGPHQPGGPEGLPAGPHQPGGPGERPLGPHQPGVPGGLPLSLHQPGVPTGPHQPGGPGEPPLGPHQPGVPGGLPLSLHQPGVPTGPHQPGGPGEPPLSPHQPGVPGGLPLGLHQPGMPGGLPLGPHQPAHPEVRPLQQLQPFPPQQPAFSIGFLNITQNGDSVTVTGTLSGLPPQQHMGFHVHQNGDLRDGCNAAGPHFNPYGNMHGGPNDRERHLGDFGNIITDRFGNAQVLVTVSGVSLTGPNSIIGRAVVVHERTDDLGRGPQPESGRTGNAGRRLACGVIGIIDPTPPCSDAASDCQFRVSQCNDPRHAKRITRDCRKTCGFCDCRDEDSRCPQFTDWCEVAAARHVHKMCRLSCGLCNCKDMSNDCAAGRQFCDDPTYGRHFSLTCPETCGKC